MKKNQDIGQKVGKLLNEMSTKLSQQELNDQLTEIAENILNFLFVLKSRGEKIDLTGYKFDFDQTIKTLSNISDDNKKDRQILKKRLSNFLHNLRYFSCINNMQLFNPRTFFRSTCKIINNNQAEFVKAEIGLINVGATCYMNSTLQAFLHNPALRDSFRYGDAKKEYDNRLNNLLDYYTRNNLLSNNWVNGMDSNSVYNNLQLWVVDNRLTALANYQNNWSDAPNCVIQEIKLILKCFADDDNFYQILKNHFGNDCKRLPSDAIDMSYEFFLLSNQADNRVEKIEKSEEVDSFFGPQRFKDFMSVKNPLFEGIAANDAKDLVEFLIMQWHEEQNRAKLNQDKNPENIAKYIRSSLQQIYMCINTMRYNYNVCKTAMLCNNTQFAGYALSNVYSCKQSIQFLIKNIIQYAQMISNMDKKYCRATSTIIQLAQILSAALGGYKGIDDFGSYFDYMYGYTNNILAVANTISNNQNYQIDQTKQDEMLEAFKKDFAKNNRSDISDQFYALNRQETRCSGCDTPKYNFQTCFSLIFPLEEVRKRVYGKDSQKSTVTLADCFEYDKRVETFSGNNSMYCNICQQNLKATMQTTLMTVPKNLILLFNRGKGIQFKVNINYPELFDQYNIGKEFMAPDQKYTIKLAYSTVKHFGNSGENGHFVMDGTSERDGSLNRYNDSLIQGVDNHGMPYLVFYRDMEPNEVINRVLKKVSSDQKLSNYLETIAIRFSELGELDIKKENNNESRRLRFSYLLMQAVLPDLVKNEKTGVREYKSLSDQQVSNLICAIFDLIKNEQNFDDQAMKNYRTVIQSEKTDMRNAKQENIDIEKTTKNMKKFSNQLQSNNINNNNINNNMNNDMNNNIIPKLNCTLKFKFEGKTFEKFIDDIYDINISEETIGSFFSGIVQQSSSVFENDKNYEIKLSSQEDSVNQCQVYSLAQYMVGGVLRFNVTKNRQNLGKQARVKKFESEEKVILSDNANADTEKNTNNPKRNAAIKNNIMGNNKINSVNSQKTLKHKSANKKLLTWLKFIFAVISAAATVVAIILESYILAVLLVAISLLILFGKSIFSVWLRRRFRCFRPQSRNGNGSRTGYSYQQQLSRNSSNYPGLNIQEEVEQH